MNFQVGQEVIVKYASGDYLVKILRINQSFIEFKQIHGPYAYTETSFIESRKHFQKILSTTTPEEFKIENL